MSEVLVNPYRYVAGDQVYTLGYVADDWEVEGSTTYHSVDVGVEIDYKSKRSTTTRGISYDLGATLSDEKWLMRMRLDIDTLNDPSGSGQYEVFALNNNDSSEPEGDSGNNTYLSLATNLSSTEKYFFSCHGVETNQHSNKVEIGSDMLATGTWYIEMIRLSTTSFSLRVTDQSDYSGGTIVTQTNVSTSVTGLRYFTSKTNQGSTDDNYMQGSFKDVIIYDNVTSI